MDIGFDVLLSVLKSLEERNNVFVDSVLEIVEVLNRCEKSVALIFDPLFDRFKTLHDFVRVCPRAAKRCNLLVLLKSIYTIKQTFQLALRLADLAKKVLQFTLSLIMFVVVLLDDIFQ
jgi:hypothetical protein